jgi:hypothetical protein
MDTVSVSVFKKSAYVMHCCHYPAVSSPSYLLFGGLFPRPPPETLPGFLLGALGGAGVFAGALGGALLVAIAVSLYAGCRPASVAFRFLAKIGSLRGRRAGDVPVFAFFPTPYRPDTLKHGVEL